MSDKEFILAEYVYELAKFLRKHNTVMKIGTLRRLLHDNDKTTYTKDSQNRKIANTVIGQSYHYITEKNNGDETEAAHIAYAFVDRNKRPAWDK